MFYDVHTYHLPKASNIVSVINYKSNMVFEENVFYSIGTHPWRVAETDFSKDEWNVIFQYASQKNIVAIGECGLDKLHANMDCQKEIFARHIELANRLQKPLIVHCVQAFEQTIQLLKNTKVSVIIHGVNNKLEKLQPFLDCGYFLSFGAALLKEKSVARKTLLSVPNTQLLLETDEADIPIATIYAEAARLKNMSLEKITLQLEQNVKQIFGWE